MFPCPHLLHLQACSAIFRPSLCLCIHNVCHWAHCYLSPHRPSCPVAMSLVSSTGSRLFPCRCCSLETPWWSDMPQQQELTLWSPEVLKDVLFSLVVFHMQLFYGWQDLLGFTGWNEWWKEEPSQLTHSHWSYKVAVVSTVSNKGLWSERLGWFKSA